MNTGRVRTLAALRVAWGAVLISPRRGPVGHLAGRAALPAPRAVTRLLAARQIVQGAATLARPERPGPTMGVVVDALHAASMVGLAAVDRRQAGWALRSAAAATGWAIAGGAAARAGTSACR